MSWLALLLIGVGLADLGHSLLRRAWWPEISAAVLVVVVDLLAGLTDARDLLALLALVLVILLWGRTVTRGFGDARPWRPLAVLTAAVILALACSPLAPEAAGPLGHWLDAATLPALRGVTPDRFLLVAGAVLVQMSTGNVVVRLVLSVTGTIAPIRVEDSTPPEEQLKGGRLLGPMERLVILGLGLAGNLTAASLVIAAKGLLRFPELQSRRDQERIHLLTEYFLVGSFVSWLVALGALILTAGSSAR